MTYIHSHTRPDGWVPVTALLHLPGIQETGASDDQTVAEVIHLHCLVTVVDSSRSYIRPVWPYNPKGTLSAAEQFFVQMGLVARHFGIELKWNTQEPADTWECLLLGELGKWRQKRVDCALVQELHEEHHDTKEASSEDKLRNREAHVHTLLRKESSYKGTNTHPSAEESSQNSSCFKENLFDIENGAVSDLSESSIVSTKAILKRLFESADVLLEIPAEEYMEVEDVERELLGCIPVRYNEEWCTIRADAGRARMKRQKETREFYNFYVEGPSGSKFISGRGELSRDVVRDISNTSRRENTKKHC